MKRKLLVSMVGILAASTALADSKDSKDSKKAYTLGDLKALVAQKAYEEAVEHLGDLVPSERTAEWLDVAATAAAGFVAQLPAEQIVYGIEAVERAYPQVLTSAKYTKQRGELGLRGYARLLDRAGGGGLEQAMRFLDGEPANAGLALGMGKVVVRAFSSKYAAAPFFGRAVAGKAPGACKDEDLKTALVSALGLPSDYDGAAAARAIADACWSEQKKTILDEAAKADSGYVLANTCEILKAKKALTARQTRICAGEKDD
jgi:hypothetical protein